MANVRGSAMASVMQKIKVVRQPKSRYSNPKQFSFTEMNDGSLAIKKDSKNISASLSGLAVDYPIHALSSGNPLNAFKLSITRAVSIGEQKQAIEQAPSVTGLSERSIAIACQWTGYYFCYRAGMASIPHKGGNSLLTKAGCPSRLWVEGGKYDVE